MAGVSIFLDRKNSAVTFPSSSVRVVFEETVYAGPNATNTITATVYAQIRAVRFC